MARLSDADLLDHVQSVLRWCKSAGNVKPAIMRALGKAYDLADDAEPDRHDCQRALWLFYSQSRVEIKRIMNGWAPQVVRAGREYVEAVDEPTTLRVAAIYSDDRRGARAYSEWRRASTFETFIMIPEGTSRAAAIEALAEAMNLVLHKWDELTALNAETNPGVTMDDDRVFCFEDEKQRLPESLNAPTRGSNKGERAMEPTAA